MKIIQLFSGGLDSTCLLYHLKREGHEVKTLSVHYGQRHKRELQAAWKISQKAGVEHREVNLEVIRPLLKGSSQTDPTVEVPEGRFDAENMKLTIVPNRNMIMISVATAWAISEKFDAVAYGAHAGDFTIYPDCREDFIQSLETAMRRADWHQVSLLRPFINLTKGGCVALGLDAKAPVEMSHSCYKGGEVACGRCGACCESLEAFAGLGKEDPRQYADREYWKTLVTK